MNTAARRPPYEPGITVLAEFVVETQIARGPVWDMYTAASADLLPVVLRVLRRRELLPEDPKRAVQAARALVPITHPGLAPVLSAGMHGGDFVIASSDIPGMSLRGWITASPSHRIASRDTARVIREAADALHHLHTQTPRVVHGSLAPRRMVLVGDEKRVVLFEWGLAQILWAGRGAESLDDPSSQPNYRAPENPLEAGDAAPAIDQFVLASIAYECLAGERAFPGEAEAVAAIRSEKRPRLSDVRDDLPREVDDVLHRAWRLDAAERFSNILEFAAELSRVLGGADATGKSGSLSLATVAPARLIQSVDQSARHPKVEDSNPALLAVVSPPPSAHAAPVQPVDKSEPGAKVLVATPVKAPSTRPTLLIGIVAAIAVCGIAGGMILSRSPQTTRPDAQSTASRTATPNSTASLGTPAAPERMAPTAQREARADVSGPIEDASSPSTQPAVRMPAVRPLETAPPATPAAPPANVNIPHWPTAGIVAQVGTLLQTEINHCAEGSAPLGRHVFVGMVIEGPTGAVIRARATGVIAPAPVLQCIEERARAIHAPPVQEARWSQSYHLLIP